MKQLRRQTRGQNHGRRIAPRRLLYAVVGIFLFCAVLGLPTLTRSAVVNIPPTLTAPLGSTPLLNDSSIGQTKTGNLNIGTILDPKNLKIIPATPTSSEPDLLIRTNGTLKLGGIPISEWQAPTTTDGVAITTSGNTNLFGNPLAGQAGWVNLLGYNHGASGSNSNYPFALRVESGLPLLLPTLKIARGAVGWTSDTLGLDTYGVYAAAGENQPANIALNGNSPKPTSWAGYFAGNVGIVPPFDLLVGGSNTDGLTPAGELCINDTCRSTWPTANDTYWTDPDGSVTYIDAGSPWYHIAVGGRDATAPFFAEKLWSGDEVVRSNGSGFNSDGTVAPDGTLGTLCIGSEDFTDCHLP